MTSSASGTAERSQSYRLYLESDGWKQRRQREMERAGFCCERCERSLADKRFQVHHLSYEHLGDERPGELEVLCVSCHLQAHGIERFPRTERTGTRREVARGVECPQCGAPAGEHCRRKRGGERESNHRVRIDAAVLEGLL